MKRKLVSLVAILFVIGACSNSSKPEKIEKDKDYFYSQSNDDIDFEGLITESGRGDALKSWQGDFGGNKEVMNQKAFVNEKIVINIKSEDAEKLQTLMDTNTELVAKARQENKDILSERESHFAWASNSLFETYASKLTQSFLWHQSYFNYPGHGFTRIALYSFDREGKLMDHESLLELEGKTLDDLVNEIESAFESMEEKVIFVEDPSQIDLETLNSDFTSTYYKLPKNYALAASEDGLKIILRAYSGLDGDFTVPKLFTLKEGKLN